MRLAKVLALVVGLVLVAAAPQTEKKAAAKSDKERLLGSWKLVKCEAAGKLVEEEKLKDGVDFTKIRFDGDRMKNMLIKLDCQFELNINSQPKQITLTEKFQGPDRDLKYYGIYSLDGDELKLCLNEDCKSDKRPVDFPTKKGDPFIFSTYKRENK